jgi:hypothetical protein
MNTYVYINQLEVCKMSGNLLEGLSPVTQTIEGGKALAKFLGLSEELPETIALANGAWLVLSKKRDCYYFVSEKICTCKAGTYGRICRHRKAMESSMPHGQSLAETLEEYDRILSKMPKSYQRMVRMAREEAESEPTELIHKGGFKPCLPEEA